MTGATTTILLGRWTSGVSARSQHVETPTISVLATRNTAPPLCLSVRGTSNILSCPRVPSHTVAGPALVPQANPWPPFQIRAALRSAILGNRRELRFHKARVRDMCELCPVSKPPWGTGTSTATRELCTVMTFLSAGGRGGSETSPTRGSAQYLQRDPGGSKRLPTCLCPPVWHHRTFNTQVTGTHKALRHGVLSHGIYFQTIPRRHFPASPAQRHRYNPDISSSPFPLLVPKPDPFLRASAFPPRCSFLSIYTGLLHLHRSAYTSTHPIHLRTLMGWCSMYACVYVLG